MLLLLWPGDQLAPVRQASSSAETDISRKSTPQGVHGTPEQTCQATSARALCGPHLRMQGALRKGSDPLAQCALARFMGGLFFCQCTMESLESLVQRPQQTRACFLRFYLVRVYRLHGTEFTNSIHVGLQASNKSAESYCRSCELHGSTQRTTRKWKER